MTQSSSSISYLERDDRPKLAYVFTPSDSQGGQLPLVMFCGGYHSDMNGTKALYLEECCKARGQAFVRFDYSGHGESEGTFEDGTIGSWLQDAQDILDYMPKGPSIVVGSSMGGWMALLLARARAGIVQGVVGIAAAPDFSEEIYHERLDDAQRAELMDKGAVAVPNDYSDEPYYYTKEFYEEAKKHLLLTQQQTVHFPIRLIQGMEDQDVPWQTAAKIQKNYSGSDVDIIFVDEGDHRLSRAGDLELIDREVQSLCEAISKS